MLNFPTFSLLSVQCYYKLQYINNHGECQPLKILNMFETDNMQAGLDW